MFTGLEWLFFAVGIAACCICFILILVIKALLSKEVNLENKVDDLIEENSRLRSKVRDLENLKERMLELCGDLNE